MYSDYYWQYDLQRAVDINTCSNERSQCNQLIYMKGLLGFELALNRNYCYYGDRDRLCTDTLPSNFTGSAHRKLCPCTIFICNGSYTTEPTLMPTMTPTFPITSIPSFKPSISFEPSKSAIPTVQVRWVLAIAGQSCTTTCASVSGQLLIVPNVYLN